MTNTTTSRQNSAAGLALITGASTGIGRALARQFVNHGYDVIVAADEGELDAAADELRKSGRKVTAVRVDLTQESGVEELHQAALNAGRPLDAVALNAGVGVSGRFDQTDLVDQLELIDLNVRSMVHLAWLVVRPMVQRGQGRILITSSIAAKAPGPYHSTYAASKAFAHWFAEGIRSELADTGVTVTSLMPGPTDTAFFDRADMGDTSIATTDKDDPDEVAADGFEALMAGKDHVVAGSAKNRMQTAAAQLLPDKIAAAVAGRQTKPGTAKN
jgi:short-subunit dehydrogenase